MIQFVKQKYQIILMNIWYFLTWINRKTVNWESQKFSHSSMRHGQSDIFFVKSFTPADFRKFRNLPKKRVICDIFYPEYWIFSISIHRIGMISQFTLLYFCIILYPVLMILKFPKNAQWYVEFFPSRNNFTRALLVTNILSVDNDSCVTVDFDAEI